MEVYCENAIQFHNTFILKLQYICCNVHFLDVVKLHTFAVILQHWTLKIHFQEM